MTIRQIRRLLPFWQEVLNLREWKIEVRWGTKKEVEGCVGRNYFSVEELDSVIVLAKNTPPHQHEETLVHELLHLVFDGHKRVEDIDTYDPLHERALNRTAAALLTLARMQREAANGEDDSTT